ncbi:rCG57398, isoform CRA_b [Rattus norvegicus]|uniref:RCG57398, isoform CRA_b n=1 Tax=Rattus norvegicus TaxID=10116 RepID=A6JP40_RAT|nr:rCG57398, isoform CRA_b [Rattus norvegicus]
MFTLFQIKLLAPRLSCFLSIVALYSKRKLQSGHRSHCTWPGHRVYNSNQRKKTHSIKMRPDTYAKKHFKHLSGSKCKSWKMKNQANKPPLEVSNPTVISPGKNNDAET